MDRLFPARGTGVALAANEPRRAPLKGFGFLHERPAAARGGAPRLMVERLLRHFVEERRRTQPKVRTQVMVRTPDGRPAVLMRLLP
jgi:hypothetical protein